jgi:dTDP-glucose pyrophosphorylase/predicted transcriptional regulator
MRPIASLREAIENLENSGMKIAVVVDERNEIIGTLTDGDIRRALLNGADLTDGISNHLNAKPITVNEKANQSDVALLFDNHKIQQIPVVNDGLEVLGLYVMQGTIQNSDISNTLLVMAGGKGTRLRPNTANCPKPMLKVDGKPILEHIIDKSRSQGIVNYIFSINYLGHMIESYFGDGSKFGIKIDYLVEESPLGTAGSLSLLPKPPTQNLIVINGDVISDINFRSLLEFHDFHKADATMAVKNFEVQNPFGVVMTSGYEISSYVEKPVVSYKINAGVYVLSPIVFPILNKNEYLDMPTFFEGIRDQKLKTVAFPVHESWIDVGRHEDLIAADQAINKRTSDDARY